MSGVISRISSTLLQGIGSYGQVAAKVSPSATIAPVQPAPAVDSRSGGTLPQNPDEMDRRAPRGTYLNITV